MGSDICGDFSEDLTMEDNDRSDRDENQDKNIDDEVTTESSGTRGLCGYLVVT
jgi:hypothetical protein